MEIDLKQYANEREVVAHCIRILSKRKDCKTAVLELKRKLMLFDMRVSHDLNRH